MSIPRLLCLLLVPCLAGCDNVSTAIAPTQRTISVGPGLTELLPHQQEGTAFPLTVLVTVGGQPAVGVEVHWYDGRFPSNLSTRLSLTDSSGVATTIWTLPFILPDRGWDTFTTQAAVPGATGNPIVYTVEVYRCTKC